MKWVRAIVMLVIAALCAAAIFTWDREIPARAALVRYFRSEGFSVTLQKDVYESRRDPALTRFEGVEPHDFSLGAYEVDWVQVGDASLALYHYYGSHNLRDGIRAWRGMAMTAYFASRPHLFTIDTTMVVYIGTDFNIITPLGEICELVLVY